MADFSAPPAAFKRGDGTLPLQNGASFEERVMSTLDPGPAVSRVYRRHGAEEKLFRCASLWFLLGLWLAGSP
ncbi:hypothetical protein CMUS01_15098 [Colletotrichum musicola]|uniref:Uncharacterized protein n=1 Tax=Colletotrichum musicola TaxID=2175873 RepID=A0A8H6IZ40_9PEZI|nr:hypothetical protein CMUS01_15098 [Colletotrichum musicola]